MDKQDKTPEEIQKRYSKIMKQSSMQLLLVPVLLIALVVGTVMNSQTVFMVCAGPVIIYMVWFRLVVYRCPKCGQPFTQYQIYTYECKKCKTKFGRG